MPIIKKRKLGPKTVDCVFLGYAKHSVGYRFLVVKSKVPDQKVGTIIESRDATFFEDIFPMRDMQSVSRLESDETPEPAIPMEYHEHKSDKSSTEDDEETPVRSKRQRTAKSFGDDFIVYLVDDTPKTISEAYASPDGAADASGTPSSGCGALGGCVAPRRTPFATYSLHYKKKTHP